ncbi:7-cyano-7-deazaguanine synthase, partial [Parvimonas sp. M20]|nr:7-cyano-7-deazaguanine synthase [Parvimonas sp. M20]
MAKMHKVYVLLSGGVDSTTTLAIARDEFPSAIFEAVTVDYGQRHKKEAEFAGAQAAFYGAEHYTLDMQGILTGMLVDKGTENEAIPDVGYADLAPGISPTYVSFRNGFMLSLIAARAQAWVMEMEQRREAARKNPTYDGELEDGFEATIYCGVHADDGVNWAYPDCTPEFIGPMSAVI